MESSNPRFTDRQALWRELEQGEHAWDLIVIGGGIIGAGILREAARRGLKALLVEQQDFAWGTSSRSSKMIHGGLRYIAKGDLKLTRDSLQERERLLREAPGLIERMGYYFTLRKWRFPGRIPFGILLWIYDWLAGIKDHHFFRPDAVEQHYKGIDSTGLSGAMYYTDTVTDDARLVLRILQDAIAAGGQALNYARVESLLQDDGQVVGVVLENTEESTALEVRARAVISATGAWADKLRNEVNPEKRIRPLRGSHLVFRTERLPVADALTMLHPEDKRPVFIFPWEGTTVVGTTDLDHNAALDEEPTITEEEVDYLLLVVDKLFPQHRISREDVISTWSGIRPVIGSERSKNPSHERRDHAVWTDKGLVTVSGGKLTTFRLIALDALHAAAGTLGDPAVTEDTDAVFTTPTISAQDLDADHDWAKRLIGRYGDRAKAILDSADSDDERRPIEGTGFCLAECRWAARNEAVLHLDDLLLRRTRLGCLLEQGAASLFDPLQPICAQELGWDDTRWQYETERYLQIWRDYYYLPVTGR
ncbi:MAG: glycerol-3-phosphate dehydrogenase/oxidase [Halioglobus sp.]|nr:glycerol-3-phosphate dehydrogenase/oxidase [Halioglobus sp.]